MNPFREAIGAALETVRNVAGASIVYSRGDDSVTLCATIGQTTVKQTTGDNFEIRKRWRDFIVAQCELVLGGRQTRPERGDEITDDDGKLYRVANLPGGPPYDVEAQNLSFRIHATLIDDPDTDTDDD